MIHSESIAKLAEALCKAQATMKHAIKDADNPFFRSKYADLQSVVEATRPSLVENGLSVVQITEGDLLWTMLLHTSGEWIKGQITLKPMKQVKDTGWVESHDPQSYGSCITYARRYAMAAITGCATEDDDGNAASGKTAITTYVTPPPNAASTAPVVITTSTAVKQEAPSSKEQNDVKDELATTCGSIATILGTDAGTVLHDLTVNKAGKFGKRSPNDILWEANGPKEPWYPMKAVLSKAKKQLDDLEAQDADVVPEDDIKW